MGFATIVLLIRFYKQASLWWRVGRPDIRWNKLHVRLGRLIKYAVIQTRILSQQYPGVMHIAIAWSFFVFFLGTALATIDAHFFKFLNGNIYLLSKFTLDSFTIFFLIGIALAAYRHSSNCLAADLEVWLYLSLILITLIVLGGLLTESFRLAVEKPAWALWSPAGWLVAQIWIATGVSDATLLSWHLGVWIFHLLIVTVTLATLPVGTLVHILTGPLNVFFSKIDRPTGQLAPIPRQQRIRRLCQHPTRPDLETITRQ